MTFRTTAAYLSGAVCGALWSSNLHKAGLPLRVDLRSPFNRIDGASFRDVLELILSEKGGDFNDAAFSSDTVVRIERRRVDAPGRYSVHVRELALSNIGCGDLVDADALASDFFGDDE